MSPLQKEPYSLVSWHDYSSYLANKFDMQSNFPIRFQFDGRNYLGQIKPLKSDSGNNNPTNFQVFLNNVYFGEIKRKGFKWETDSPKCAIMVDTIGSHIDGYF
jgi:hypothetical protein